MQAHDFRQILDPSHDLNPVRIKNARTKIRDVRRKTEVLSEIESQTKQKHKCPHCGDDRRQKWGRTLAGRHILSNHLQRAYRIARCFDAP